MLPSRLEIYGIIGVLIALLVVGVFFRDKMQKAEIAQLKTSVENLKSGQEVIKGAQEKTEKYLESQKKAVKANVARKETIDKAVETVDNPTMDRLFIDRGLLKPKSQPAPSR